MWDVPDNWSLREAATVPVVYATAYYALCVRGGLRNGKNHKSVFGLLTTHTPLGQTILIHSGAGGVGLAAIAVALSMGCHVFTTVGSEEKKQWLLVHAC